MYEYKIKELVRVYDGDTITVILDLGFDITMKQVIRLYGIDTPELRGAEREEGLKSKAELIRLIENCPDMYIKTYKDKKGKYGRMLGALMDPNSSISLNEELVRTGFAKAYFGGKK